METKLGKIQKISFGIGGYNDAMLGLFVTLGDGSWGITTENSTWDANIIKCSKHAKWTEEDRSRDYDTIMRKISDLLKEAKVGDVYKLMNTPVEVTFDGNSLKSWRILTEVI